METILYDKLENNRVRCRICSHFCVIREGKKGICNVRENRQGDLISLVYGKVISHGVDPIEKKPIFHLKPGSLSYSIATVGCNLKCSFCQNSQIAHDLAAPVHLDDKGMAGGRQMTPRMIVDQALSTGCQSISYTYTEPTVFFELALDTAKTARQAGLFNIFVTNGFMSADALDLVSPYLDAANVDLKSFSDEFYKKFCKARLEPVKERLRQMKQKGILVEVTTLLIPGLNDDPDELKAMAEFIANDLGCETPWHISRFHPSYKMRDRGATPVASLTAACETGKKAGLRYVYMGNVPGSEFENTRCHQCNALLVERHGYRIQNFITENRCCPNCAEPVYGIL